MGIVVLFFVVVSTSVRYAPVNCYTFFLKIISKRRGELLDSACHGFHSYVELPEGTSTELFIGTLSRDSENPYIRWKE